MGATPDIVAPANRIKVTESDIVNATAQNQFQCAIVRAVQREIPDATRVSANRKHIAWTVGEQRFVYNTPPVAVEAVIKPFDTGGKPEPIALQLTNGYVKPVEHLEPEGKKVRRNYERVRTGQPNYQSGRHYERFEVTE
jgi:hypothetical protein